MTMGNMLMPNHLDSVFDCSSINVAIKGSPLLPLYAVKNRFSFFKRSQHALEHEKFINRPDFFY